MRTTFTFLKVFMAAGFLLSGAGLALSQTVTLPDTVTVPCVGDSTNVVPSVSGGTTPYSYSWSNGSTNDTLLDVPAGTYTLTVTDNNSNTATGSVVVINPAPIVSSASVVQDLVCDYDTSTVVAVGSGGTPIEGYLVDTSGTFNPDTTQVGTPVTLSDDQASGFLPIGFDFVFFDNTYSQFQIVSNGFITFANSTASGCCSGQNIPNVNTPNDVVALAWDDLYPPGNGSITYYTTGTAPFRRLVVNYINIPFCCGSTPAISAQAILFETTNCIEIHTAFVNSASPATQGIENASGTEAYVYPGRNSSSWSATADFVSFCPVDTSGLLYNWSNGMAGAQLYGLEPGTYTVTVSDLNGCFNTHEVTVSQPVSHLQTNVVATDVTCFAANDGTIDPGIFGGVQNYLYAWSNNETSATLSNLGPGSYSVSVEDQVGCTIEVHDIVIWEPALLQSVVNNIQNVLCPGDSTGSASAVAIGGVQPYTYSWLPAGFGGQMATGLTDGTYNLVVTDANGCQSYTTLTVLAQSTTPSIDLGPDIFDPTGGTATLDAGNHTSYLWSNASTGSTLAVTQTGTYWVQVSNSDGCTNSDTVYVEIWPTGIVTVDGAAMGLRVYPNPAQDFLQFEMDADITSVSLNVVDVRGSIVLSTQLQNDGVVTLDVSRLPAGVYNMNISNGDVVSNHRLTIAR